MFKYYTFKFNFKKPVISLAAQIVRVHSIILDIAYSSL